MFEFLESAKVRSLERELEEARRQMARASAGFEERYARLEGVLCGMSEGVLAVDAAGRVSYLNPRLEELFDLKAGQALGRPQMEVLRDAGVNALLGEALKGRQPAPRDLLVLRPAERTFMVQATPLGPVERPAGAVAVFLDVTRERRLQAMRSEFVANVSHELKTPLTAIRASLETLADGALEDPGVNRSFLQKALRHTERLTLLIDDLLVLSGIEDRQRRGQVEAQGRSALAEAYAAAASLVEGRAALRKVGVQAAFPTGLPETAMNLESLTRVLTNLLDNAVKYSPEGGSVRVEAEALGAAGLKVQVQDQGPGIAPADQLRLFERFYRPDKARSRELGGTGLGLSIVKHLLESVGGQVGLSSQVGQGSTFWLILPQAEAVEGSHKEA
jgi:two-component system phosphate regulon sensor histidine kinase PhoR